MSGDDVESGTRVTLVRHAESVMNQRRREVVGGRSNHTPLTPHGLAAAAALGRALGAGGRAPDAVVSTSAVRSAQTACALVDGAGWALPILVDDGLLELSQGIAEGRPRGQWWTPAAIAAMTADPLGHRLAPGGETHREVQHRMRTALRRLHDLAPGGHVLAIGHGIAIRTLAWSLLSGGHDVFTGLDLPNLGHVEFTVTPRAIDLTGDPWSSSAHQRPQASSL